MFYQNKIVLVTGGTGLVGTHIVNELLKCDAKIRVPIHHRKPMTDDSRIEYFQSDLTREEECLAAANGVDYVFHAAGTVGSAGASAVDLMGGMTNNLVLTSRMLHAAWYQGVKRFLVVSSSTVYPPADYPIKEDEAWSGPTYPGYFGYGWLKRYLEKLAEYVATQSAMKVAVVRPTAIYGPGDTFDLAAGHVIPALIRKAIERQDPYEVWGTGEEVRDFLHTTDLARGCLMALEKYAECDPINLAYGKTSTIREIVRIILKAADYEDADVRFDTSKPTAAPIRVVDGSKAKKLLGFEPALTLEEGLSDTVKWYAQHSAALGKSVG